MKKIVVLGIGGMAGHVIYTDLKSIDKYEVKGTVYTTQHQDEGFPLDVTNTSDVQRFLETEKPDVIINCIGMLIKGSQAEPSKTILVNSYLPHLLKEVIGRWHGRLIHISTDCVFSGKKGGYIETDAKDATDLYGQSKALGEIIDSQNLTIRTSIIGPELKKNGEGLFHWFMQQEGTINGYSSAYWSGVTTIELSKFIQFVIEKPVNGLYHLTNNTKIDKFSLLSIIKDVFSRDNIQISKFSDKQVDKSFINSHPVEGYLVPGYKDMITAQKNFMVAHRDFYSHYSF